MRLFILINLQKKDKELILVDNREKAKKTRVIRVITRSYGRSNNGKEQDTIESTSESTSGSNLTTTQMKKEDQDPSDLEILISNDVNNIIEKRTNKEHSDSSNISPTSASSLTTNPMRKIINNFRTSIINLSLFEKFQLGYLIFMFIFFILPIVLFKMGNINLFFDIVSAMETAQTVQSAEELFIIRLKTTPVYKNARLNINPLIANARAFRESVFFDILKKDPKELGVLFGFFETKLGRDKMINEVYQFVKNWQFVVGKYIYPNNNNGQLLSTLHTDTMKYVLSICNEAKLSPHLTRNVMDLLYNFLVKEQSSLLRISEFRHSNIFFGFTIDKTNGELVDDFLKRERAKFPFTPPTPATGSTPMAPMPMAQRTTPAAIYNDTTATPATGSTPMAPMPMAQRTTPAAIYNDTTATPAATTPTTAILAPLTTATTTTDQVPLTTPTPATESTPLPPMARPAATTAIYNDFGTPDFGRPAATTPTTAILAPLTTATTTTDQVPLTTPTPATESTPMAPMPLAQRTTPAAIYNDTTATPAATTPTTAIIAPTATPATPVTTVIVLPVIPWFGHYLDPTIATPATATTATTTAHVPFSPNMILPPSLRTTVIPWFGHYLDPTIATPATTTATTTTTTATTTQAIVSNIDTSSTSSTSANTSTTSANTSNGNEPRRSLLVGRRSPEPLSDHTKKNFGGIGEHYNNFRNSPYFYHITIGTIAVSAVAIGIVIYNYS